MAEPLHLTCNVYFRSGYCVDRVAKSYLRLTAIQQHAQTRSVLNFLWVLLIKRCRYTFEHYELPGVGGGVTTALQLQEYPLDFAPAWDMGEASGQRDGHFPAESPAQLIVQDWLAFIGGGVRGQLWFDLSYSVNEQIIEAASSVGTQLAYLAGGILSPVQVIQPLATSNTDGILARAFDNARGEVYVAAVNERLAPVPNISLSVVLADGTSPLATAAGCRLSVPFEESRTLSASSGLITESLGSYEARVYRVDCATQTQAAAPKPDVGADSHAIPGANLVHNAQFTAQTLPGTPDQWLLFPTAGTPSGSMDLQAVLLADPAAARHGSNTTIALRVVLSDPLGTGIHVPLGSLDYVGLSSTKRYNFSFWAKTNAVTEAGVLILARSLRTWHYGDSSPTLLESLESYVLGPAWQQYNTVISEINGTLNLLPRQAGVMWLSELSITELDARKELS